MIKRLFLGFLPIVAGLFFSQSASARDFTCTYKLVDRRSQVIEFFEAVSYYSKSDACYEARLACEEIEDFYYDARCRRVNEPSPGRGTYTDIITCNHLGGGRKICGVNGRVVNVELIEQYSSRGTCFEGYTYGRAQTGVWVEDGCRGRFRVTYRRGRPGTGNPPDIIIPIPVPIPVPIPDPWPNPGRLTETFVTCDSRELGYRECRVPGRIVEAYVANQYSSTRCSQGYTYGFFNDRLWVDDGCRARFRVLYR